MCQERDCGWCSQHSILYLGGQWDAVRLMVNEINEFVSDFARRFGMVVPAEELQAARRGIELSRPSLAVEVEEATIETRFGPQRVHRLRLVEQARPTYDPPIFLPARYLPQEGIVTHDEEPDRRIAPEQPVAVDWPTPALIEQE